MLVMDGITAADRRTAVMQHADITLKAYNDDSDKLDAKILNGDDLAKTWLQTETASRTLITLSNILTAWLIASGIGGTENNERNRQLKDMAMKIVEIQNQKGEAQQTRITLSSNKSGGTFSRCFGE